MKRRICALLLLLLLLPMPALGAFMLPKDMPEMTFQAEIPKGVFSAVVVSRDARIRDPRSGQTLATLSPGTVVSVTSAARGRAQVEHGAAFGWMDTDDLMSLVAVAAVVKRDSVVIDCKWPRGAVHTSEVNAYPVRAGTVVYAAGLHGEGMIVINEKGAAVGYISPKDIARMPMGWAA